TSPHGSVKVPAPAPPPTLEFTLNPDVPKLFGLTKASQSLRQTGASSPRHPFSFPTQASPFGLPVSAPRRWKLSQVGPDAPLQKNSASSTANTGLPPITNATVRASVATMVVLNVLLRMIRSPVLCVL